MARPVLEKLELLGEEFVPAVRVAEILGVHPDTVRRRCRAKQVPFARVKGVYYIPKKEIEKLRRDIDFSKSVSKPRKKPAEKVEETEAEEVEKYRLWLFRIQGKYLWFALFQDTEDEQVIQGMILPKTSVKVLVKMLRNGTVTEEDKERFLERVAPHVKDRAELFFALVKENIGNVGLKIYGGEQE